MHTLRALGHAIAGTDVKIRRQLKYWASTVVLYSLCLAVLWYVTWTGETPLNAATILTVIIMTAVLLFYVLIRGSRKFNLSPPQLAAFQGNFAIACTVAAYSLTGPVRGATLTILAVVLVFCAFALKPEKSRSMSLFAIILLGAVMLWMIVSDPVRYRPQLEAVHFLLASATLLVVASLTGQLSSLRLRLKEQKEELEDALERLRLLATRDELTSLANRRHMGEILHEEERRQDRQGKPVSLALIDIDRFKEINERYGQAVGDEVLRMFAHETQKIVRSCDVLSRWEGEEFLLLMPDTELHAAGAVLDRIKGKLSTLKVPNAPADISITFSAGVTSLHRGETTNNAIQRADKAMVDAKMQGRNCTVITH